MTGKAEAASKRVAVPIPRFADWLATQATNTEPVRAEAARHIASRWALTAWYMHDRVLRALAHEGSPHLAGARLLAADFATQFGITAESAHPLGATILPFTPSLETCREYRPNGRLCGREAVPGTGVCGRHGGQWLTEEERAKVVAQVTDRILDATDAALRVVLELMDNGVSEKVRLDAAVAILDRAKPPTAQKIELEITNAGQQAAAEILARLDALAEAEQDTVTVEVVSDTSDAAQS